MALNNAKRDQLRHAVREAKRVEDEIQFLNDAMSFYCLPYGEGMTDAQHAKLTEIRTELYEEKRIIYLTFKEDLLTPKEKR